MPECDYCEESFDSESAYLGHLEAEHEGELGRLDQRRVDDLDEGRSLDVGAIVLAVVVVGGLLVGVYAAVISGGFGSDAEGPHGSAHEHGVMYMEVNGEPVNFAQDKYLLQDEHFHFDRPEDRIRSSDRFVWHVHSQGVTLQYALESLGMSVSDDGSELAFEGETYRDDDPDTAVRIRVDNRAVEPAEYELSGTHETGAKNGEGDTIRVIISSDQS